MLRFNCKDIVVLRLSKEFNEDYNVDIPPRCHVELAAQVPVYFEYDRDKPYGFATLRRDRNRILANIELWSDMYPPEEVRGLLQAMYPVIGFLAMAYLGDDLTHIKIDALSLTMTPNEDEKVPALGDRVCFLDQGELH